jgi:hypothetical protein
MMPVCLPEKYEILGELGSGGMGLVYHARDRVLDREVALKVLTEQYAADPQFAQRFLTEARAAASLNHPNIVQIYEFGETGKGHYLAMELVRGGSLKAQLKTVGRFSEPRTVELVLIACTTLGVAHRAGIVHRDVKPDNMMFTERGDFKLVDLGLAKNLHDDAGRTMTGQSLGTPHFISPEQIMGARVIDARADVYSLGATMYNLATGSVPFDGTSGAHIMARHLNDPLPDPRRFAPGLSDGFCQVLGRMMAKSPDDRYQSMADLERDLRLLQQGRRPELSGAVPTGVQQTVFLSASEVATATPATAPATWDDALLERLTRRLAEHVGPLARVLVRQAAAAATTWGALCRDLERHVPDAAMRAQFAAAAAKLCDGSVSSVSSPTLEIFHATTQPIGADSAAAVRAAALDLDDGARERVTRLLADHIGPVASVLVRREMKRARDLDDLAARLAGAIPDDAGRGAFAAACRRAAG